MRLGSLFAGILGFDEGFRQAGWTPVWAVEKEPFCQAVIRSRHPETELFSDVKEVGKQNLSAVDAIVGGFPCQGLSVAGKRAGLADDRSGLFWEAHRIIGELRPTWFVIENVPGFFSSWADGEETARGNFDRTGVDEFQGQEFRERGTWREFIQSNDFDTAISALSELRYGLSWCVLDSRYFNVAQRRERVFIVGHSSGVCPAEVLFNGAGRAGDSPQGGGERKELAYEIAASLRGVGGGPRGFNLDAEQGLAVIGSLQSHAQRHGHAMSTQQAAESGQIVATLNSAGNSGGFRTEPGEHIVAVRLAQTSNNGWGISEDGTTHTLDSTGGDVGAFGWNKSSSQTMRIDSETTDALQASESSNPAVCIGESNTIKPLYIQGLIDIIDSYANAIKANPGEVLQIMQQEIRTQEDAKRRLGVLVSLHAPQVLQPSVFRQGQHGPEKATGGGYDRALPCAETQEKNSLREVRLHKESGYPPQGRKYKQQQRRKSGSPLPAMPQLSASQVAALRHLWETPEGVGLLQQALHSLQEVWRSFGVPHSCSQEVLDVRESSQCSWTLRQALHAAQERGSASRKVGAGVMSVRRLTPV